MLPQPRRESSMPHRPTPTTQDPKDTPERARAREPLRWPDTRAVAVRKEEEGRQAGRSAFWVRGPSGFGSEGLRRSHGSGQVSLSSPPLPGGDLIAITITAIVISGCLNLLNLALVGNQALYPFSSWQKSVFSPHTMVGETEGNTVRGKAELQA